MNRKKKNLLTWLSIIGITLVSVIVVVVLCININEDPSTGAKSVQFDWLETACSLLSGAASVILGVVAVVQTEKANKLAEELTEIDRMQFENASVTAELPLIEFRKKFDIHDGILKLDFTDQKGIELKKAEIWDMHLYPFSSNYRAHEADETIVIQEKGHKKRVERISDDDYRLELRIRPQDFYQFEKFCLEFELGVVNEEEVAAVYRFKLLVRGENFGLSSRKLARRRQNSSKNSPKSTRRQNSLILTRRKNFHFHVFHQFYEIVETMGEEKFEERASWDQKCRENVAKMTLKVSRKHQNLYSSCYN